MNGKKWEILYKGTRQKALGTSGIVDVLLENRGIKTKKDRNEFFEPTEPSMLALEALGISELGIRKAIKRIKQALANKEKVIVYGDYDADGVCGTAVLWETLHGMGVNALPYIPDRFSEGYGLNSETIKNLKSQDPNIKLIITVDNGIVAFDAIKMANSLGVDVIVTDHHDPEKKNPKALAIIHTQKTSGSAVAWILSRELGGKNGLELVAIGTIADQLPLIGISRNFVKHGLAALKKTERVGLLHMFEEAKIEKDNIGPYEVGFVIAPRINSAGRMGSAMDSLRLLCTKDSRKSKLLSVNIGKSNLDRQKVVEDVVTHAKLLMENDTSRNIIILSHESYHEGVIGLAASRLVETFYRPAIVISKGEKFSKASARSVAGFNIIETIRKVGDLLVAGGGHPMAAGFTVATSDLEIFVQRLSEIAAPLLTEEILTRRLRIDMELQFSQLGWELQKKLEDFEPTGLGNPTASFVTRGVKIADSRLVGSDGRHVKLKLEGDGQELGAIAFGFGSRFADVQKGAVADVVYALEKNVWNGNESLQLKVKDIRMSHEAAD